MRRRSTFVPNPGADYDPSRLKVDDQKLSLEGLKAAREERLTFSLKDLPPGLADVISTSHELHIRWVSERAYRKSSPYLSSIPSGLHVHYTPALAEHAHNAELCHLLLDAFSSELRCKTPTDSFTRPDILSDRFASASSFQYYSQLPSLRHFVGWLQQSICAPLDVDCRSSIALLDGVSYVDIDCDVISHALILSAYWSQPPNHVVDPVRGEQTKDAWDSDIQGSKQHVTEVGLLTATDSGYEPSEISIEGFLAVLGEDTEPKATSFFFPSRHHTLQPQQADAQRYTVTYDQPTGLHPDLRISFPKAATLNVPTNKPLDSTCALHAYFTLPSVFFIDEYAFPTQDPDPLFKGAHNIVALRSLSGERDLEAPDYVIQKWGLALLLELAHPNANSSRHEPPWDITVPLHLRSLAPAEGGLRNATLPWPSLFWACTADEGIKFTVNPFDRVNLGYDGLFGPRTMFYHLEPAVSVGDRLVSSVQVPVVDTSTMNLALVELFTGIAVLIGFLWVASKVLAAMVWEYGFWLGEDDHIKQKKAQ